jgi:hypothetical protein
MMSSILLRFPVSDGTSELDELSWLSKVTFFERSQKHGFSLINIALEIPQEQEIPFRSDPIHQSPYNH